MRIGLSAYHLRGERLESTTHASCARKVVATHGLARTNTGSARVASQFFFSSATLWKKEAAPPDAFRHAAMNRSIEKFFQYYPVLFAGARASAPALAPP